MGKLYERVVGLIRMLWREVAKFGVVGAVAWVIDTGVFLFLMDGPLHSGEVWAKGWATVVASVFSWAANRYWTFRHRKQNNAMREFVLFAVMNAIGLIIAAGCVAFTKYVLHMNSSMAMFISGSVVGLVLGTIFRYFAYRFWVFNDVMDEDEKFKDDRELLHRKAVAAALAEGKDHETAVAEAEALQVARDLEAASGFETDPEAQEKTLAQQGQVATAPETGQTPRV